MQAVKEDCIKTFGPRGSTCRRPLQEQASQSWNQSRARAIPPTKKAYGVTRQEGEVFRALDALTIRTATLRR